MKENVMQNQRAIAPISPPRQVSFPDQREWQQIIDIASRAHRSGLLPMGIKNAEAASIIALKAWELGISPMMAFSHIHVINGKPTISAELMQSLARKNLPGLLINIIESTNEKATVEIKRPERGSIAMKYSFSIQDAEKAKLLSKDVWKQYPRAMLWSRVVSAALRATCPDALMGVSYTAEELGAEVNPDGTVIETTSRPVQEVSPSETTSSNEVAKEEVPASDSERMSVMNTLVKEMVSPEVTELVKIYVKETYKVDTLKTLSSDQLKQTLEFVKSQVKIVEAAIQPEPWQVEADEIDPRYVK